MDSGFFWILLAAAVLFGVFYFRKRLAGSARHKEPERRQHIASYDWPPGLLDKVQEAYPHLTPADCRKVSNGLKQFFQAYLRGGCRLVSMPSQVVDKLWHEFILHTRDYDAFCKEAFGRFLHHVPAAVLAQNKNSSNEGLRRVWRQCCEIENIDPRNPNRLPLLFAIDGLLKIEDGFLYDLDCKKLKGPEGGGDSGLILYCAVDFSSTAFDGTTRGLDDDESSSSGSSSDSAGDSSGCSSGCGGGGD